MPCGVLSEHTLVSCLPWNFCRVPTLSMVGFRPEVVNTPVGLPDSKGCRAVRPGKCYGGLHATS